MPDTDENRGCWPYAGGQKRGCGFPTGKLGGLFCLHTGRLIAFAQSSWKAHDLSLARPLLRWLHASEVLVADRAYCGWFFLVQLLARKVDFVIRLHQSRTVRSRRYRSWREVWKKPQRPKGQSKRSWKKQPEELLLRLVRFQVQARDFAPKTSSSSPPCSTKKPFPTRLSPNSMPAAGRSNSIIAKSRPTFRSTSCAAALPTWSNASCGCTPSPIISSARCSWKPPSPTMSLSNASASRAPSTLCRPGPNVRCVPVVTVVWPAARSSPASPPIRSRYAPAGPSRGRGNDARKTTSF